MYGPEDDDDDYDYEEDIPGVNRVSGNRCRNCGRIGCEGGLSCVNMNGEPGEG